MTFFFLSSNHFSCGIKKTENTEAIVKILPCWIFFLSQKKSTVENSVKKHQLQVSPTNLRFRKRYLPDLRTLGHIYRCQRDHILKELAMQKYKV